MVKVFGIGLVLALMSFTTQARDYDIDTCGEVKETAQGIARESLKHEFRAPMDEVMAHVIKDSIKRNGLYKKGRGAYNVQQAFYFLEEYSAHFSMNITYRKNTLKDLDIAAELVAVDMSTLCFEHLGRQNKLSSN